MSILHGATAVPVQGNRRQQVNSRERRAVKRGNFTALVTSDGGGRFPTEGIGGAGQKPAPTEVPPAQRGQRKPADTLHLERPASADSRAINPWRAAPRRSATGRRSSRASG